MLWLWITISFYFILAVVFLIDKHFLTGPIPKPEVYTFYIGISWVLVLLLVPFVNFYIPEIKQIIISFLAGASFVYGILWFNKSLCKFEASRVVPAVGAMSPLFTFFMVYISSSEKEALPFSGIVAFLLLILGSILISLEKGKFINIQSLKNSLVAAFLFSLSSVLTKYVYLRQTFWNGFIWTKIGGVLTALLFFIFYREIREEIFKKRDIFPKETFALFVSNQSLGAVSNILQNWAFNIVPIAYLAVIQVLQGAQYAFLLILTILLSLKFPKFIKEEISRGVITQKIVAILLIGVGIAILALK
jgi:hypothetical protein